MRKRSKLLVDTEVQGAFAFRVVFYWVLCAWGMFCLLVGIPLAVLWWQHSPDTATAFKIIHLTWLEFRLPMVASFLMVPLMIWDVLRLTNRHVGPLSRLRTALNDLSNGKPVSQLHFRKDDLWVDLAESFNRVASRYQPATFHENDAEPQPMAAAQETDEQLSV